MTKPLADAVRVARMYYYGERTTQEIAEELGVSRSRVSRLLKLAKAEGLVEIRIVDPGAQAKGLESAIAAVWESKTSLVPTPAGSTTSAAPETGSPTLSLTAATFIPSSRAYSIIASVSLG